MKLHELKVLHRNQPVIDEMPEFSWKIESDAQNELQEKYQIRENTIDFAFDILLS